MNICPECKNDAWSTVVSNHVWQCHTCGYIKKENLWEENDKKWDRSLGTSKEEQEISTPSNPVRKPNSCDCFFIDGKLYQVCFTHSVGLKLAEKTLKEKNMKNKEPIEKMEKQSMGTPWVETTKTEDTVSVGIVTPEESA